MGEAMKSWWDEYKPVVGGCLVYISAGAFLFLSWGHSMVYRLIGLVLIGLVVAVVVLHNKVLQIEKRLDRLDKGKK